MILFYQIILVIPYGIQVWYGNLSAQLNSKLARRTQTATKSIRKKEHRYFQPLYQKICAQGGSEDSERPRIRGVAFMLMVQNAKLQANPARKCIHSILNQNIK